MVKLEDKFILSDGRKLSTSLTSLNEVKLEDKFLHTVDSPEPSCGSRTHRELHSMQGSFCIIASVFGSSTSPCSRCPCLGQFVVSCPMQGSAEAICGSLAALDAFSVGIRLTTKPAETRGLYCVSAAPLVSGSCPYSPASSYAVSE